MSKILQWILKNQLIIFLTIVTFIILGIPLLRYGAPGTFFYQIDPDVVYVTNAILYIKSGIVFYVDHPGTPTIILLSWIFIPLKLLTKFYFHKDFIQWSFDNFVFLTFYSRIIQLILYSSSLFIFLKAINRKNKSILMIMFSFFAFFSIMQVQNAIFVVPETLSIFLTAVWLFFFVDFSLKRSYKLNIVLVVISALAVANKFTSVFLLIPSIFLPMFIDKLNFQNKLIKFGLNILISVLVFLLGIFPAINRFGYLISWTKSLFLHTDVYGRGVESVFNWKSYLTSFLSLITGAPIPFAIIFSTVILGIYFVSKKKIKVTAPILFLTATTFAGILVFAKYFVIRYFIVDFELIIFCLSYFLSKSKVLLTVLLSILLIVPFIETISVYWKGQTGRFDLAMAYRQIYISKNSAKTNTLWGYGVESVYGELQGWTSGWSDNVFGDEFNVKPVLYLSYDLKNINFIGGSDDKKGVFDVCWDKAYLLNKDVDKFLNMYKDKNLKAFPIPGDSSIYEIDSTHCTMK